MKVMHLLNTSSFSGAENVVIAIINATKDTVDSSYVSFDGSIEAVLSKNTIRFVPVTKMSTAEIKRVVKLLRPDIIHAHDFTTSVVAAISFVKVPIISHLHNNSPWIKTICLNSLLFLLSSFRIKKIVGVSQSIFDEYIFGKLIRKKTKVISNPVDVRSIVQNSLTSAITATNYDIVFLGRLSTPKNPLRFIKLIKLVQPDRIGLKSAMIGSGEMESECISQISTDALTETIDMLGFVDNPYPILSRAKMMVMPSIWEGFGLAAVEALALGVPVIASPVGGLVDIVTEKCGKLCRDDEEFITEINRMLDDEEYRKTKSDNAFKRASEMDNIEKYVNDLLQLYKLIAHVE